MNGRRTWRGLAANCARMELPKVSAVMPVLSETKKTVRFGMRGVWINRSNRLYDLSCVRPDGTTENLIFLEDNPMANLQLEMVRRCMRGWP